MKKPAYLLFYGEHVAKLTLYQCLNFCSDCGVVYVSTGCRAPREELKQLIISGGGRVANVVRVAE